MISFQATYFDGKSSKAREITVTVSSKRFHFRCDEQEFDSVPVKNCRIAEPLGSTPRVIKFPDGSQCSTTDFKAVAQIEEHYGVNRGMRFVNVVESHWRVIAFCIVGLVAVVYGFSRYGIPELAKWAAYSLPDKVVEGVSRQTIEIMDKKLFETTELSAKRIAEVKAIFQRVTAESEAPLKYRLQFRRSSALGANAFATPSGNILITDKLVQLAEKEEELEGIFAHEIAHVENMHGLRSILQNTGVFFLISAIVGDVASITSSAASIPTLLLETGYSRKFEREADEAAALYFIRKNQSTKPLQDILLRMSEGRPERAGESFLSTHPVTESRIKFLQDLEQSL